MSFEIKNIKKSYGKITPLSDISLNIACGQCVGILGKNGSGKSTLLSILAGVQKCDGGDFLFEGRSLLKNPALHREQVGYVPQGTPLIEELSARDNLRLWYDKRTIAARMSDVIGMLGVDEFMDLQVKKMSGGMKKRLSIACAMLKNPGLLLFDEPCAALDLVCKQSIYGYLNAFKQGGGAVLITTHDESDLALCDSIYILRQGELSAYSYDGHIDRLVREL
jgi:ABC-2 type transport system ATP-binding protein